MIKEFDRPSLKSFEAEMRQVLEMLASRHGVKLSITGGRFNTNSFRPKIEFQTLTTTEGSGPAVSNSDVNECRAFGIDPSLLNTKRFFHKGEEFVFIGVKPRSHKFPILTRSVTNPDRRFKFPMSILLKK